MTFAKIAAVAAAFAGFSLISAPGNAAVIYNNLGASSDGTDAAQSFGPLFGSFSTGASGILTGLSLLLEASEPSDGGTFTIGLFADNSTSPGSAIGSSTFNDSVLSSSLAPFSETTSFSLSADTRYWIGLSSTGSANWSFSTDTSGPGVAGEFFANSTGVFPATDGPYQMQVTASSASVVPEPSTWAMMALGFAGLGFMGYRTSRKSVAVA